MANAGRQADVRSVLADAMREFFASLIVPKETSVLSAEDGERLIVLVDLATRCRSAVERDGRDREIELVPQAEALGRLQAVFTQIVRGLRVAGVSDGEVDRLTWHWHSTAFPRSGAASSGSSPKHLLASTSLPPRSPTRLAFRRVRCIEPCRTWLRTMLSSGIPTATSTAGALPLGFENGGKRQSSPSRADGATGRQ